MSRPNSNPAPVPATIGQVKSMLESIERDMMLKDAAHKLKYEKLNKAYQDLARQHNDLKNAVKDKNNYIQSLELAARARLSEDALRYKRKRDSDEDIIAKAVEERFSEEKLRMEKLYAVKHRVPESPQEVTQITIAIAYQPTYSRVQLIVHPDSTLAQVVSQLSFQVKTYPDYGLQRAGVPWEDTSQTLRSLGLGNGCQIMYNRLFLE